MRSSQDYKILKKNIFFMLKAIEAEKFAEVKNKVKISHCLAILLQEHFKVGIKMSTTKKRFSINDIDDIIDTVRVIELFFAKEKNK